VSEIKTKPSAGKSSSAIGLSFLNHLTHTIGRPLEYSTSVEQYHALAHVVRDQVMENWIATIESYKHGNIRVVAYLSAEYLLGPHLLNDLLNLGLTQDCDKALKEFGLDLATIASQEPEPGLGNGGLGRLAACFMDSLSTLGVPAIGYGLRYEFGMFRQEIRGGWQVERSDKWLQFGNPWEIPISDASFEVKYGGHTETWTDEAGHLRWRWVPETVVRGIPYDTPIPGYQTITVNRQPSAFVEGGGGGFLRPRDL
jgi:glycogen phosphorylase